MQNKKLYLVMALGVLLVGAAAFLSGRMLNTKIAPAMLSGNVQVAPAEELPDARPEVTGLFIERNDNSIIVEPKGSKISGGPHVEVVSTGKTIIYKETTDMTGILPYGNDQTIQQTVGEGQLDDINPHALVLVWGRKSGDRVIAELLFYSNIMVDQKP